MAPGPPKRALRQSKVPSIKKLCNRFRFQDSIQIRALPSKTHAFRKSYKASDGSDGTNLANWTSPKARQDLRAMAVNFAASGDGEQFLSRSTTWMEDKTK